MIKRCRVLGNVYFLNPVSLLNLLNLLNLFP